MKKARVTYLTQVPGPYREKMHTILGFQKNLQYSVIYCAELEPNRSWKLDYGDYHKYFLEEKSKTYRHNNPKVWSLLNNLNPDVLIITAFKPTMLYGVLWCILKNRKYIVYNDGTLESEKDFSFIQKSLRKLVFKKASSFAAPGKGTVDLYKSYEVDSSKIFISHLCVDNKRFSNPPITERNYDALFCGQIINRKMPGFFVDVIKEVNKRLPEVKILIVGDGDKRIEMLQRLDDLELTYSFKGFVDQNELPECYSMTKIFLFPTLNDPWGIVVNEACASGMPIITCPVAGVSYDLVQDGENGFILEPEIKSWADRIVMLLTDNALLRKMSNKSLTIVQKYNHEAAAKGLIDAIDVALTGK